MNKEQFKEYRRNQRICYSYDDGYPYKREAYFNKIPFHEPPRLRPPSNLVKALVGARKQFEYRDVPGSTWGRREMVLIGNDNPDAGAQVRRIMRNNYTPY